MPNGLRGPYSVEQRQAGHDRGQREGQVDEAVDDRLAGEVVTHQDPRDERAHHGVDEHDRRARRGTSAGCAASACGLVIGVEERVQAAGDRLPEERRDRDEDDQPQVERGDAGAQEAPAVVAGRGRPADRCGRAPAALRQASRPRFAEDLGHDAGLRVEELGPRLGPAAQVLIDRGQVGRAARSPGTAQRPLRTSGRKPWLPKTVCASGVYRKSTNAAAGVGRVAGEGGRDRVLDEQRRVRHDVLERLAGLLGEDRLVLVGDEDVALARGQERVQRVTRAAVPDRDVARRAASRYSIASSSVLPASICAW